MEPAIKRSVNVGNVEMNSMLREMSVSTMPPKYPATMPTQMPMMVEKVTTVKAVVSETRAA